MRQERSISDAPATPDHRTWAPDAIARLSPIGLNVWGVADGTPWQDVLPGCRGVLVIGNGGTALWDAFNDWVSKVPARASLAAPLDAMVADAIAPLPMHRSRRWILCASEDGSHIDFRTLAHSAGLGHPSRLGLLLHPTYGPWVGLRAACFTTDILPITGPLTTRPSCDGCPAPCSAACPVQAVTPSGWASKPCLSFQRTDTTCHGGCLARSACVVGTPHAYSDAQHRYHQHAPSRRGLLEAIVPTAPRSDRG